MDKNSDKDPKINFFTPCPAPQPQGCLYPHPSPPPPVKTNLPPLKDNKSNSNKSNSNK